MGWGNLFRRREPQPPKSFRDYCAECHQKLQDLEPALFDGRCIALQAEWRAFQRLRDSHADGNSKRPEFTEKGQLAEIEAGLDGPRINLLGKVLPALKKLSMVETDKEKSVLADEMRMNLLSIYSRLRARRDVLQEFANGIYALERDKKWKNDGHAKIRAVNGAVQNTDDTIKKFEAVQKIALEKILPVAEAAQKSMHQGIQ